MVAKKNDGCLAFWLAIKNGRAGYRAATSFFLPIKTNQIFMGLVGQNCFFLYKQRNRRTNG